MDNETKQCETCPWPVECPPEERPAQPASCCPRQHGVWERSVGEALPPMPSSAPLATLED